MVCFQIRSILKCKHIVEHFASHESSAKLLLKKWYILEEIKQILHLPYLSTVMLQKKDFTLSDFFGCLQIMEMKLNKLINNPSRIQHTKLAENFKFCLDQRKKKLVDNPLMICAIFLDPRFKCEMDAYPQKIIFAKLTLEQLFDRIKSMKNNNETNIDVVSVEACNKSTEDMSDLYAELDEQYCDMGLQSRQCTDSSNDSNAIKTGISKYEQFVLGNRMKSSESIHAFWNAHKSTFGWELYEIACIIFAIPPTQAAVERCFSALKYLFDEYRCNLNENLLESCLLIHLNPDFYKSVKESDIERVFKNI